MSESATKTNTPVQESTRTFSCPSCGGKAVFDPETLKLKCAYCGAVTDVETMPFTPQEYDIDSAPRENAEDWGGRVRVFRCEGCGAETVLEGEQTSEFCAFCGSPHVALDQSSAGIAPESVLPFSITQKAAVEGFRRWLKKKWFAPSSAKKNAMLGKITGVYLPHWTYDAQSRSLYRGQAGHHYYVNVTRTVTRDGKQVQETVQEQRTRWVPASGVVENDFDDILVAGSKRLTENLLSRVRPYDLGRLTKYKPEFLAGFSSEKPSVTLKEGWGRAQELIDERMTELAREDILSHADEARVSQIKTENKNVKYKLTLLPMYLSAFNFKNKVFNVLVNGQNGKVGGQAPVSAIRVIAAILVFLAVVVGLYFVFQGADVPPMDF